MDSSVDVISYCKHASYCESIGMANPTLKALLKACVLLSLTWGWLIRSVVYVVETLKGTVVAAFSLECSLAESEETGRVWV